MNSQNKKDLDGHFLRNAQMWGMWEKNGVTPGTQLTVNFHFYAAKKVNMELLCHELKSDNIPFRVTETKTLFFFKGWKVDADVTKEWTLVELQGKTANMFLMSLQKNVAFEGCGAFMPSR